MSLFHKLQDVYFDSLQLSEALSQIPSQCDCPEEARRNGTCCCSNPRVREEKNRCCLKYLNEMSKKIEWAMEDLRYEKQQLREEEMEEDAANALFLVENRINHLGSALNRIKELLSQPYTGCLHEELERLREHNARLQHNAEMLNRVL